MAVNLSPPFKIRIEPGLSESSRYRRGETKVKAKKIPKRFKVRPKHVAISLIFVMGLFVAAQQGLLFLMSWNQLNIERIEVRCGKPGLRTAAAGWLEQNAFGNLLVFDIRKLRKAMEDHSWIKSVRVRKHFPETLRVEIRERTPAAILQLDTFTLIDDQGVELAPTQLRYDWKLPLFIDKAQFSIDRDEKLALAWRFLSEMLPEDKVRIDAIDVSFFTDIRVKRTDFPAWLYFGKDSFSKKMENFKSETDLLKEYLPLEYVDLSLVDRIAIKPLAPTAGGISAPERR